MKKTDAPKPRPALRRQPTQERALQTIETIFGATAQIVEQQGEAAVTTNRIAEVAGFSIGTLYQYFPSKEAILLAMVERERNRVQQEIQQLLDAAVAERREVRAVLREMVGLLVSAFGTGRSLAGRQMVRLGWRIDHHDRITAALREGAERNALALSRLVEEGGNASVRLPTPAMMFVATRAVMGAIRSAALENSPLLGTPVFEEELVRMVWGLLRADGDAPQAAA